MTQRKRLSWGIPELDKLTGGGLPVGAAILVQGGPGTGKTILGLHFVAAAARSGESALVISFSDSETKLRDYTHQLEIDISQTACLDLTPSPDHLTGKETYEIFSPSEVDRGPVTSKIVDALDRYRPHRVFIDGFSIFRYLHPDHYLYRRQLIALMRFLQERRCTTLFSSEIASQFIDDELIFTADGVITLQLLERIRRFRIEKLRDSSYFSGWSQFELTAKGWRVFPPIDHDVTPRIATPQPQPTGFGPLDQLLGGGLVSGSTLLITGQECIGKTLFALGLAKSLTQTLPRGGIVLLEDQQRALVARARRVGIDLQELEAKQRLFIEESPFDESAAALLHRIRVLVEPRRCRFVVIDGLNDFLQRDGLEPVIRMWMRLKRYAALHGVILLATWRTDAAQQLPPPALADVEFALSATKTGLEKQLTIRYNRFATPTDRHLRWQLTDCGLEIDVCFDT